MWRHDIFAAILVYNRGLRDVRKWNTNKVHITKLSLSKVDCSESEGKAS